jgi:hypothetical protein
MEDSQPHTFVESTARYHTYFIMADFSHLASPCAEWTSFLQHLSLPPPPPDFTTALDIRDIRRPSTRRGSLRMVLNYARWETTV